MTAWMLVLTLSMIAPLTWPAEAAGQSPYGEWPVLEEDGRAYVWDAEKEVYLQDKALTEHPVISGNLTPAVALVDPETMTIQPGLDVQGCLAESAFTVTGDVRVAYEGDVAPDVTAVAADSLPDFVHEDEPGSQPASVRVGGDISSSALATADGGMASAVGLSVRGHGEVKATVGGNISAAARTTDEGGEEQEFAFARAMDAMANGGTVDITVAGNLTAEGNAAEGRGAAHGIAIDANKEGTVTLHVRGDTVVTSSGAGNGGGEEDASGRVTNTYGILAMAEDGGTAAVTLDGKVSASSDETGGVAAAAEVSAVDPGSRADLTIGKGAEGRVAAFAVQGGEISITVKEGGIISASGQEGALHGESNHGSLLLDVTGDIQATDTAEQPGLAMGADLVAKNEGTLTLTLEGNIAAAADQGAEGIYASGISTDGNGGFVTALISGNVTADARAAEGGMCGATAVSATAFSDNAPNSVVTVDVGGNAQALAVHGDGVAESVAVNAGATGRGNDIQIHVGGDAIAVSESTEADVTQEFGTRAVYADSHSGGTVQVTVDGTAAARVTEEVALSRSVQADADGEGSETTVRVGGAEGTVSASAILGGHTAVTVAGDVTAALEGISAGAGDGSSAEIEVTGNISTREAAFVPGESYGAVLVTGGDGKVTADLAGNIEAVGEGGYTVGLAAENEEGTVSVHAHGDIAANGGEHSYGLEFYAGHGAKTDIIVDGTVYGKGEKGAAVVLIQPETQIGENVTLTVWQLVPNEDGAVVFRKEQGQSPDFIEDEAAEKAVQYIIRVQADQEEIITPLGTEEYQGYDVAHEGDTVTLQLNVPAGYRVTAAYGDADQSIPLSQDAEGNYYVSVPRGGGVELSVTMEPEDGGSAVPGKQPASGREHEPVRPHTGGESGVVIPVTVQVPETGNEPVTVNVPVRVTELLRITDKTGKTGIVFYSGGSWRVNYEDGTHETGTYSLKDGILTLVRGGTPELEMPVSSRDGGLYELRFRPSADPETIILFEMTEDQMNLLQNR